MTLKHGRSAAWPSAVFALAAIQGCSDSETALAPAPTPAPVPVPAPAPVALTCDDTMKAGFKPDANTTVVFVKAFKAGERGNDQAGKDQQGKIMATIAAQMSDTQMKALSDYVSGLR